jgi:hypothetical protein
LSMGMRQGLNQKSVLPYSRVGKIDVLAGPMLEDLMQWMGVTNVGVAAKVLLDVGSALKGGASFRVLLECLRGA